MRKSITLLTTLIALTVLGAKAQTTPNTTGATNVHVDLRDVLELTVNNADVTLPFTAPADYLNGVSVPQTGHLTVTSNKPYTLSAKAAGNFAAAVVANGSIITGALAVTLPATGNNTSLGGAITAITAMTTANLPLLTGGVPAASKLIDVTYAVPAAVAKSTAVLGKPADIYTTIVTYTITQ
jgi:hypothetical protein